MKKILLLTFCLFIGFGLYAQSKNKEIEKYVHKYYKIAIHEMKTHKIPASITLAQGVLESGWGKSNLATKSNNHFGIKCKSNWEGGKVYHDDDELQECFRKYDSVEDSYKDHSLFLVQGKRYAFLFDLRITDYKAWANGLKKAGYATNPIYAKRLIDLIEMYELYKYDNPKKYGVDLSDKPKVEKPIEKPKKEIVKISKPTIKHESRAIGYKKGRQMFVQNKCKYVVVEKGDTWEDLAAVVGKGVHKLYTFNEVTDPTQELVEGSFVYLQKKKKKSNLNGQTYTTLTEGETIYTISQKYALQVDVLSEENSLMKHDKLPVGKEVVLK